MKTPTELDFKIYTKIHDYYDMSSPASFIISYINNGCDETYMDNELTELQCKAGANRSFSDLYRLASTYFDTVDRLQLLYDLIASYKLDCFICQNIKKLVFIKEKSEDFSITQFIIENGAGFTYNYSCKNVTMTRDKYLTKKELKDAFRKVYKNRNKLNAIEGTIKESVIFSTDLGDEYVRITI
jgi:hypothetical protein